MRILVTGDLHLTDRKLDTYRWGLFDWLREQRFDALVILGDLTEEKDCHAAELANRVVDELMTFVDLEREVHVLMGNHDYNDEAYPFFRFLRHCPGCHYHAKPGIWELGNARWAFYPHSREPERYWVDARRGDDVGVDYTLLHQLFRGAKAANGVPMDGADAGQLSGVGKVFAGDVHWPQKIGVVEYVGAPYPINFGDDYQPHVVVVDGRESWHYLTPPSIRKLVLEIDDPGKIEFKPGWRAGDQVKVVMRLGRSTFSKWEDYRREVKRVCDRNDLVLCGLELKEKVRERLGAKKPKAVPVTPVEQFDSYCRQAKVSDDDVVVGKKLLDVG